MPGQSLDMMMMRRGVMKNITSAMMIVPYMEMRPNSLKPRNLETIITPKAAAIVSVDENAAEPVSMMASLMENIRSWLCQNSSLKRKTNWMPKSMPKPARMPPKMAVMMLSLPMVTYVKPNVRQMA